ncbi:hypothetical protein BJX63DRAFT_433438 [Aspergillus granulosus]|uniref:Uncharacterized protein n=1 Tax=Aspergillus granulosus TaxID=176169 RepID=A0ABR4H7J0_9EURO
MPVHEKVVQSLYEKSQFREALGKEKNYPKFLEFFQQEIEQKGTEAALSEYVFAEDENAESMMAQLFGGLLHPIIHLEFAIEFNQPAIISEVLAQTVVHDDWIGPSFLWPAEKVAGGIRNRGEKTMLQLLEEARANEKLAKEMINIASQYTVSEEQIQEKFAEMFDFFYIHTVNSSIFYSKILPLPSLATHTRLRLLEWKGRMDLIMHISRNAPALYLDEITQYPITNDWETINARSNQHPDDDGYLSKLVRALRNAEHVCKRYMGQEKERGLKIIGDMWLRIGNMVNDSVKGKGGEAMWVRSTGFDEAWVDFDDSARL